MGGETDMPKFLNGRQAVVGQAAHARLFHLRGLGAAFCGGRVGRKLCATLQKHSVHQHAECCTVPSCRCGPGTTRRRTRSGATATRCRRRSA